MKQGWIILLLFVLVSCNKEPVETIFPDVDIQNGVFIACEGNFMYGNGTLSFYNPQQQEVVNQLFFARNNAPLGDVVQSLAFYNHSLYIVVNNSGKIYSVDPQSVKFKGVITGLISPRYIHFLGTDKAYVSDLYAEHLTIIDPRNLESTGIVELPGHHSEQMVQFGQYVFVSDWSYGNHVLIVDTEQDKLVNKIQVPYQPRDLVIDGHQKIWVLCEGGPGSNGQEIRAALCRIDPETFTTEQIYRFNEGEHPRDLQVNNQGDTLYYISSGVCKMAVNADALPDPVFIAGRNRLCYSLAIDPLNNDIYVSDAIDYTQNAIIYRYNQRGSIIDSFKVGINPNDFLFTYNF